MTILVCQNDSDLNLNLTKSHPSQHHRQQLVTLLLTSPALITAQASTVIQSTPTPTLSLKRDTPSFPSELSPQ